MPPWLGNSAAALLAQTRTPGAATRNLPTILLALGGLIVAVIALGLVILWLRRRMLGGGGGGGLEAQRGVLDDLRAMRDRGEITPDEYDAARSKVATRLAGRPIGQSAPPASGKPARPAPGEPAERIAPPGFDLTGAPLPPRTPDGQR